MGGEGWRRWRRGRGVRGWRGGGGRCQVTQWFKLSTVNELTKRLIVKETSFFANSIICMYT